MEVAGEQQLKAQVRQLEDNQGKVVCQDVGIVRADYYYVSKQVSKALEGTNKSVIMVMEGADNSGSGSASPAMAKSPSSQPSTVISTPKLYAKSGSATSGATQVSCRIT
jgi:hypothetical protein